MAYQSGDLVQFTDYNSIVVQINELFGVGNGDKGYGGNSVGVPIVGDIPTLVGVQLIDNENWFDVLKAQENIRDHQGSVLPEPLPLESDLEDGDIIFALDDQTPDNPKGEILSAANLAELTTNRLNVDPSNLTNSNKLASSRTSAWTSSVMHEFTVTFDDEDHARYFFNTGGQILLGASRTGGTSKSQNTAWTSLLNNNSPYTFGAAEYYTLTTSFVLYTSFSEIIDPFSSNTWDIYAKTNGMNLGGNNGNGFVLTFSSEFYDNYFGMDDFVDGLLISTISENKSTAIFNINSPVYATNTPLTDTPPPTHFETVFDITVDTFNYNLYDELILAGWDGSQAVRVNVNIDSGAIIGSIDTLTPAFTTNTLPNTFPGGADIQINNSGRIQGRGGNGGKGGSTFQNGKAGKIGGDALDVNFDIVIDNTSGEIWSGGGGGGGGAGITQNSNHGPEGGGGGAGSNPGSGGGGGPARNHHSNCNNGCSGKIGTQTSGGTTGNCHPSGSGCGSVPRGGKGGGPGLSGNNGSNYGSKSGGAGGSPGNAIVSNGNTVTIMGTGDIRGAQI